MDNLRKSFVVRLKADNLVRTREEQIKSFETRVMSAWTRYLPAKHFQYLPQVLEAIRAGRISRVWFVTDTPCVGATMVGFGRGGKISKWYFST